MPVLNGLDQLSSNNVISMLTGNLGYLCHSASVNGYLEHGVDLLMKETKLKLKKIFGPQHGFVTDVQDNMVETKHTLHPIYNIPIYSLYSETRVPTDEMLEGLDTMIIDLQDVGVRVYTYISTMHLLMEKIHKEGRPLKIVVFDRPNPARLDIVEGTVLNPEYQSFVGRAKLPQRHGLTFGEVARFYQQTEFPSVKLEVVTMKNLDRHSSVYGLSQLWVNPSPNLSTRESALIFPGSVIFEGTNISEGRGTTRALEQVGHPKLMPYKFADHINDLFLKHKVGGIKARAVNFFPMFQKYAGSACGGVFLHPTDETNARSWRASQILLRELYQELGEHFKWNDKPYEYESNRLAIDYINGSDELRLWVERNGHVDDLLHFEDRDLKEFLAVSRDLLFYR
jgi:uncharacterized protein YbbC (DUF1343 family)